MFYVDLPDITNEQRQKRITELVVKINELSATICGLKLQYIHEHLYNLFGWTWFNFPYDVFVKFEDGPEKCRFEGLTKYGYDSDVILRHYTKNGKLFKKVARYPYSIVDDFCKEESEAHYLIGES